MQPTSHVGAHTGKGVDAHAILVQRDPLISLVSKRALKEYGLPGHRFLAAHCRNATRARRENKRASLLMREALDQLPATRRVVLSYEALISLRESYLREVLTHLGLDRSWDGFLPTLENGNAPYIRPLDANGRISGAGGVTLREKLQPRVEMLRAQHIRATTNMSRAATATAKQAKSKGFLKPGYRHVGAARP